MGMTVYADPSDAINKVKINVRVPEDYEPIVPGYYKRYPERRPIYEHNTPDSYSMMTIAQMLDMSENNIPFTIVRGEDVLFIKSTIDRYYNAVWHHVVANQDTDPIKQLLIRLRRFSNKLEKPNARYDRETQNSSVIKRTPSLESIMMKFMRGI